MIKIAIPTRDEQVDDPFGHCDHYTLFTIDNQKQIIEKEYLASPEGCGCKSDIASILEEKGITLMLAGNMGEGAKNMLNSHHIEVIRGCKGDIKEVVKQYLSGFIFDSGKSCHHHEGHVCSHNR